MQFLGKPKLRILLVLDMMFLTQDVFNVSIVLDTGGTKTLRACLQLYWKSKLHFGPYIITPVAVCTSFIKNRQTGPYTVT